MRGIASACITTAASAPLVIFAEPHVDERTRAVPVRRRRHAVVAFISFRVDSQRLCPASRSIGCLRFLHMCTERLLTRLC